MAEGVAILVTIGKKPEGGALYPNWLDLPLASSGIGDTEKRILSKAEQIHGWIYDKESGHDDDTPGSPRGTQQGILIVTKKFADQAVAMYGGPPHNVRILTEAEAENFWDTKGMAHVQTEKIDIEALQALEIKRNLTVALGRSTTELDLIISNALDPDNKEAGVRKNHKKAYQDAKIRMNLTYGRTS